MLSGTIAPHCQQDGENARSTHGVWTDTIAPNVTMVAALGEEVGFTPRGWRNMGDTHFGYGHIPSGRSRSRQARTRSRGPKQCASIKVCRHNTARRTTRPRAAAVESKEFETRHTAFEIGKRTRVQMAVHEERSLAVDNWTDLSKDANDVVIVTDVRKRGENVTRIINVHDEHETHSRERPARKLWWQWIIGQGGTVLRGDFNPHRWGWDPTCIEQWDSVFWQDVTDETKPEIWSHDWACQY